MGNAVYNGKVKFFNAEKGYGFLINDDDEKEYFFHVSKVLGNVIKDDLVFFELTEGKKGLQAVNVKRLA